MTDRRRFAALCLLIALLLLAAVAIDAVPRQAQAGMPRATWPPAPYAEWRTVAARTETPRATVQRTAKAWPGTATPRASCTPWATSIYHGPTVAGDRWGY